MQEFQQHQVKSETSPSNWSQNLKNRLSKQFCSSGACNKLHRNLCILVVLMDFRQRLYTKPSQREALPSTTFLEDLKVLTLNKKKNTHVGGCSIDPVLHLFRRHCSVS